MSRGATGDKGHGDSGRRWANGGGGGVTIEGGKSVANVHD
jgi:hypothetical protein